MLSEAEPVFRLVDIPLSRTSPQAGCVTAGTDCELLHHVAVAINIARSIEWRGDAYRRLPGDPWNDVRNAVAKRAAGGVIVDVRAPRQVGSRFFVGGYPGVYDAIERAGNGRTLFSAGARPDFAGEQAGNSGRLATSGTSEYVRTGGAPLTRSYDCGDLFARLRLEDVLPLAGTGSDNVVIANIRIMPIAGDTARANKLGVLDHDSPGPHTVTCGSASALPGTAEFKTMPFFCLPHTDGDVLNFEITSPRTGLFLTARGAEFAGVIERDGGGGAIDLSVTEATGAVREIGIADVAVIRINTTVTGMTADHNVDAGNRYDTLTHVLGIGAAYDGDRRGFIVVEPRAGERRTEKRAPLTAASHLIADLMNSQQRACTLQ